MHFQFSHRVFFQGEMIQNILKTVPETLTKLEDRIREKKGQYFNGNKVLTEGSDVKNGITTS